MKSAPIRYQVVSSPLGSVLVAARSAGICALRFLDESSGAEVAATLSTSLGAPLVEDASPHLRRAARELTAYFEGRLVRFTVPVELSGTPLQRRVWDALLEIPFGQTRTYGEIAARIGRPDATRAVAGACGRNPALILVPCHRVIRTDGELGGYSGGLVRKRRLLALESRAEPSLPLFKVATDRRKRDERTRRIDSALDELPPRLREWIEEQDRPEDGAPDIDPERWVVLAQEHAPDLPLATVAEAVSERAVASGSPMLRALTAELVSAAATELHEERPDEATLESLLRAAARAGWTSLGPLAAPLVADRRLPRKLRRVLLDFLEAVLGERLPGTEDVRERAVDLWVAAGGPERSSTWAVVGDDDPSRSFGKAGLWLEAAVAAERALADGHGDRNRLFEDLVRAYEQLGELDVARERLIALALEVEDPELRARLRRLEDRLRRRH